MLEFIYDNPINNDTVETNESLVIEEQEPVKNLMLPNEVYELLPPFLVNAAKALKEPIEKDVFLLGALSIISGCLPNIYGIYDGRRVGANIYTFIIAPASAGKGSLIWAKMLVTPIHLEKRAKTQDNIAKMLLIPANNSSSGFIEALFNNDERGILYCTEADTLSGALVQEWGDYSELLRTAYHHESYEMMRRNNREYSELKRPHLSILLSGTPAQIHKLIPNAENGLFSRFAFYTFDLKPIMKNVFDIEANDYEAHFAAYGERLKRLHEKLELLSEPIRFDFSTTQKTTFHETFNQWHEEFHLMLGNNSIASIRRLGLIHFRLCMILSMLHYEEAENLPNEVTCSDQDFNNAFLIVEILKAHAAKLFSNFKQDRKNNQLTGIKRQLYNCLPNSDFSRKEALKLAHKIGINRITLDRFLQTSYFEKSSYGNYQKRLE